MSINSPTFTRAIVFWNEHHLERPLSGHYTSLKAAGLGKTIFLAYDKEANGYFLREFNVFERTIRCLKALLNKFFSCNYYGSLLTDEQKKILKSLSIPPSQPHDPSLENDRNANSTLYANTIDSSSNLKQDPSSRYSTPLKESGTTDHHDLSQLPITIVSTPPKGENLTTAPFLKRNESGGTNQHPSPGSEISQQPSPTQNSHTSALGSRQTSSSGVVDSQKSTPIMSRSTQASPIPSDSKSRSAGPTPQSESSNRSAQPTPLPPEVTGQLLSSSSAAANEDSTTNLLGEPLVRFSNQLTAANTTSHLGTMHFSHAGSQFIPKMSTFLNHGNQSNIPFKDDGYDEKRPYSKKTAQTYDYADSYAREEKKDREDFLPSSSSLQASKVTSHRQPLRSTISPTPSSQTAQWTERKYTYILDGVAKAVMQAYSNSLTPRNVPASQDVILYESISGSIAHLNEDSKNSPLRKTLNLKVIDILEILYPTKKGTIKEKRAEFFTNLEYAYEAYKTWLSSEEALRYSENPPIGVRMLRKIARALFVNEIPQQFYREVFFDFIAKGTLNQKGSTHNYEKVEGILINRLQDDRDAIADPKIISREDVGNLVTNTAYHSVNDFIPLRDNNFSSLIYSEHFKTIDGELNVKCLRFGTPTRDQKKFKNLLFFQKISGQSPPVQILEEFRIFLDDIRQNKEIHLYFNHQSFTPTTINDESERVAVLHELQRDYPASFYVFDMPMDGDFFSQQGSPALVSKSEFISGFQTEINDTKKGRPLEHLERKTENRSDEHKKIFNDLINTTSFLFFGTKVDLTIDQRIAFQLIAYIMIQERFLFELQPVSYNSTCKDAIDRAGIINGLRYYLYLIKSGKENDEVSLNEFRVILQWPALIVKSHAIINSRFELLRKTLEHLLTLTPEEKRQIREFYKEWNHTVYIPGGELITQPTDKEFGFEELYHDESADKIQNTLLESEPILKET